MRRASPADAEVIEALERAGAARPWSLAQIRGHLASPSGTTWVLTNPPAGHLLGMRAADGAEVLSIVVHPDHRRRGLGRALLEAARRDWAAEGVVEAFLEVRTDNGPAQAAYRSDGWVEVGRRPRYYHDGCDALLFRRDLP